MYKFNIYFLIISILFSQNTKSHGFGANTLVKLSDGHHAHIYSICLYALGKKIAVASCDIDTMRVVNQWVKIGKKSECNCFIRLGFNDHRNEADDIICTPLQEFYVPAMGEWLPAYMLRPGDALLSSNLTTKTILYKELIEESLKTYMLEVQNAHTFFVGKDSILTHNIFLPAALGVGFTIPFGSVATGAIGGFFGPIGLVVGLTVGGIAGAACKLLYEKRIQRYKTFDCNISFIKEHDNAKHSGCFVPEHSTESSYIYVTPVDDNLISKPTGCIEITPHIVADKSFDGCNKHHEIETKIQNEGCFQPIEQNDLVSFYFQEQQKLGNKPLSARNLKEFKENTPIGREYGAKFIPTGKQNPKDGSPIYKLSEDIPNTEMFKKGYYYALDRFHEGDHFEVWNKRRKWVGVANLDGSKNCKKTNAVTDTSNRDLPR